MEAGGSAAGGSASAELVFGDVARFAGFDVALREFGRLSSFELPYKLSENHAQEIIRNGANGLNIPQDTRLYEYGFAADFMLCCLVSLFFLFVRSLVFKKALLPLASGLGIRKLRKRQKFAESTWFFLYYVPIFCWGFYEISFHRLTWPYENLYAYYPHEFQTFSLKLYVIIQLSFYFSAFVVVVILEEHRKDFIEMVLHHVVTIILIVWSMFLNYRNIATTVLVLHDFSDVFLYLTKSLHYAQFKNVKNITFGIFAISFLVARLVYFPTIIYSFYFTEELERKWEYPYYFSRNLQNNVTVTFSTLLMLHIFWFKQILRTIVKALTAEDDYQDPRSDDEEDE